MAMSVVYTTCGGMLVHENHEEMEHQYIRKMIRSITFLKISLVLIAGVIACQPAGAFLSRDSIGEANILISRIKTIQGARSFLTTPATIVTTEDTPAPNTIWKIASKLRRESLGKLKSNDQKGYLIRLNLQCQLAFACAMIKPRTGHLRTDLSAILNTVSYLTTSIKSVAEINSQQSAAAKMKPIITISKSAEKECGQILDMLPRMKVTADHAKVLKRLRTLLAALASQTS